MSESDNKNMQLNQHDETEYPREAMKSSDKETDGNMKRIENFDSKSSLESSDRFTVLVEGVDNVRGENMMPQASFSSNPGGDEESSIGLPILKIVSTKAEEYTILNKHERILLALLLALVGMCSAMSMPILDSANPTGKGFPYNGSPYQLHSHIISMFPGSCTGVCLVVI